MFNVIMKQKAEDVQVSLSDGRMMTVEDVVTDYERLLTSELKRNNKIASKLKVGEHFLIDRDLIEKNKEKIKRECYEEGIAGRKLWKRFEYANKMADENPGEFPCYIQTYIPERSWNYITVGEIKEMCCDGYEWANDIICDLELQMRICNGESVHSLVGEVDKLPDKRIVRKIGESDLYIFGGSCDDEEEIAPAELDFSGCYYFLDNDEIVAVPYMFRRAEA